MVSSFKYVIFFLAFLSFFPNICLFYNQVDSSNILKLVNSH